MPPSRFAIIDVETTGLSPGYDRILELAILVYDGEKILDTFTTLVNPQFRIPLQISRLTGITSAVAQEAPPFYEIARKVVELTEDCVLVGHQVRFDYAFLRAEFRRLGYDFRRRHICTLRMSRRYLPHLSSHSLEALCRYFGIDGHGAHHRAMGDAYRTLHLFRRLRRLTGAASEEKSGPTSPSRSDPLSREIGNAILPPALDREVLSRLPEETGIYFFYDAGGALLYIGKSNCIRRRVLGHFSGDLRSPKEAFLKAEVARIEYQITGSELIALLLESHLVKLYQPRYNRDQKMITAAYGLYQYLDKEGYLCLFLRPGREDGAFLIGFANRLEGQQFLERLIRTHELCQKRCGLHKTGGACFHYHLRRCRGACIGAEPPESYNRRVTAAIARVDYPYPDFAIIDRGRTEGERSVVLVEQGIYRGFGYLSVEEVEAGDREIFRRAIQPMPDHPDFRRIIARYL
ncbi:MAG: DNA polymerase III subunit epsilon, partial [Calditrichaeota bacterium]